MTSIDGGKGSLLDALATDELYQRMLRLKQKYRQAEMELGAGDSSFAFNGTGGEAAHEAQPHGGSRNGAVARARSQQQRRGGHRSRSRSDSACMFLNPAHLQNLMRKLMSEIGSCHVDTILEFLRQHWDEVRGGDMIPYNVAECRKHVFQRLRNDTAIFARDTENEGCWTLTRDEESENSEIKYYEPQIDCIMRAMEESESGEYTVDYISAYVIKNWARRHPLSDAEIKESVKLTLTTNPRFYFDSSVPGGLVYLRAKKQNQPWSSDKMEEEKRLSDQEAASAAAAMTTMAPPPAPVVSSTTDDVTSTTTTSSSASTFIFNSGAAVVVGSDIQKVAVSTDQLSPSADGASVKRSTRNRVLSPPAGYACKCGATTPGKGAACKWRKGPDGEFLCNNCGLQSAKKAKSERRKEGKRSPERSTKKDKKIKKEQRSKENTEDEDEDEDDEDSPWICCDNCGQWVLAKDDNIDDVSIYDDSNPNHLDYFCPQCREPSTEHPVKEEENSGKENDSTPTGGEEERWSFGEDNEGEESGITSSETTPHLNSNGSRKRNRTASLYSEVDAAKRKVRPRTRSHHTPISADIMGETVSIGGESKLDMAEHKIRLEWERTVSHQEGEEVDPEVSELEERFWNDIQKYKTLLMQTRDSLWSKNLVDYKKKKEKLKREREKLDAKAESDLMRQFMEYFKKKKRKLVDEREALIAQRTHNP